MNTTHSSVQTSTQTPARMVAGALAHLAQHMATGCPRSAYLAAMLLEQIGEDAEADDHLRRHARQLVEILNREDDLFGEPLHGVARNEPSVSCPDSLPRARAVMGSS